MRILHVAHGFVPEATGGVELHCAGLARALARAGHEVFVFCRCGDAGREEYALETAVNDGIEVTRVNYTFRDCRDFRTIYANARMDAVFGAFLDRVRPDVAHFHHFTGLSTNLPAVARAHGIKTVLSLHDFWLVCPRGQLMGADLKLCEPLDRGRCRACLERLWPHFPWKRPGILARLLGRGGPDPVAEYDRHVRGVLAAPDLLLTPCEFHRQVFIRLGVDPGRIRTVPLGMDTALFAGASPRRDAGGPVRLGFIGSVIPTKGVHVLVDAFAGMDPTRAVLDIHGEIPPFHGDEEYGHAIRRRAVPGSGIAVHGRYENRDVPAILRGLDILVVPSLWYEAFSLTIREGFLAGVPVVASRRGAMAEAIEDGVTGLLFEAGDAADLREKLTRLAGDADLRARLAAAPKGVKDVGTYAGEMEEIYRGLGADGRSGA